jgi:hypothetical protein
MDAIASLNPSATQASQAVQAGQANTAAATPQSQSTSSGLPPVLLAGPASTNTLNAELVSSQWGVDPALVGGVYGGAASDSGGLFAGDALLPLLTDLSHANAEQALSLIGIQTPTAAGGAASASGSTAAATSSQAQAALAEAATGTSAPMIVDPLWGRSA